MSQDENNQTTGVSPTTQASELLKEIEAALGEFERKTNNITERAEHLMKELDETDISEDVRKIERDAAREINEATVEHVEDVATLEEDQKEA